jgi:DNA-binding MarR family transcriptional regulator
VQQPSSRTQSVDPAERADANFKDGVGVPPGFWLKIKAEKLSAEEVKVMFRLTPYIDYENWTTLNIEAIAEDCKLGPEFVSRVIQRLVDIGLIETAVAPKARRGVMAHRLNSHFGE